MNIARGALIQGKPLYEALTSGRLRGYAADAWPNYEFGQAFPAGYVPRLQKLPNVIDSNEQAANADDVLERNIDAGIQSLVEFAAGQPLSHEVDVERGYQGPDAPSLSPTEPPQVTPMLKTALQRLGLGVVTLLVVSLLVFSAVNLLPGDFATEIMGQDATPEAVAAFRRELQLDQPTLQRYVHWIGGVVQGDFGISFAGAGARGGPQVRTVISMVGPRLANTLFLAAVTAAIAVPLSLLLGIFAALHRNSVYDRMVNTVSLTCVSIPEFFLGYILILLLAIKYPIFYSLANVSADMPLLERIGRCALPIMTLVLTIVAHMMRMTRAAIINLMASPYVETARLKGVTRRRLIFYHVLPNAWAPIATVIALTLAFLLVGVVVVEVVFVYPGIGRLMVDSVSARDLPLVQACALIFAVIYVLLNLLADIVSIVTNPRLLHPR